MYDPITAGERVRPAGGRVRVTESGDLDAGPLPWERPEGPTTGTGICVSGGGLRAASFHLGALQELQEQRGLLFGPASADVLAAVSGGAYIAAAQTLVASRLRPGTAAPFAPTSPEDLHVSSNARYLVAGGPFKTAVRFGGPILLTLAATLVLLVWTGVMLATSAFTVDRLFEAPDGDWSSWWPWVLAAVAAVALRVAVAWFWTDDPVRRYLGFLVVGAVAVLLSSFLVGALSRIDVLSEWSAWSFGWWWLLTIPALVVLVALPIIVQKLGATGVPGAAALRFALGLGTWLPITAGLIVTSIVAVQWRTVYDDEVFDELTNAEALALLGAFFTVLIGAVIWAKLLERLPLHLPYRDLLSRCFAIDRSGETVTVHGGTDVTLSELAPPSDEAARFPRLLICATANVKWTSPRGRRSRFAPFVFSHDRCGVPGSPGAHHATTQLELDRKRVGVMNPRDQPTVSLMGAVAASGAAVSPSMGAMTSNAVRPLLAALGVRLGLWVSNPLWPRSRVRVERADEPARIYREKKLEYGYDRLFQEMMGLHTWRSAEVFVTDGGHYDNLGLLALLRARCAEIFCIDAQADPTGAAKVVKGVFQLAADELGVTHDLDLEAFATRDGVMPVTHVRGTISYPDGATASITVVKLGLHHTSPPYLLSRRRDRRWRSGKRRWSFPTHPTFMQVFDADRFRAYQALGRDATARALHPPG